MLDLLTHLVEKSLVVLEAEGERYRLLETVRQYAQERLDESGERPTAARARHLAFYLALAEEARPELRRRRSRARGSRGSTSSARTCSPRTRGATAAEGGGELGLRLVSAVRRYWIIRGLLGLGTA